MNYLENQTIYRDYTCSHKGETVLVREILSFSKITKNYQKIYATRNCLYVDGNKYYPTQQQETFGRVIDRPEYEEAEYEETQRPSQELRQKAADFLAQHNKKDPLDLFFSMFAITTPITIALTIISGRQVFESTLKSAFELVFAGTFVALGAQIIIVTPVLLTLSYAKTYTETLVLGR